VAAGEVIYTTVPKRTASRDGKDGADDLYATVTKPSGGAAGDGEGEDATYSRATTGDNDALYSTIEKHVDNGGGGGEEDDPDSFYATATMPGSNTFDVPPPRVKFVAATNTAPDSTYSTVQTTGRMVSGDGGGGLADANGAYSVVYVGTQPPNSFPNPIPIPIPNPNPNPYPNPNPNPTPSPY
jgi:hypothetical protein